MKEEWNKLMRQKRLEYGLSQNKLATAAGISRQYLSEIETGKYVPSKQLRDLLERELARESPDCPLDLLFDYVRIRFPTMDIEHITEQVLRIKFKRLLYEDYGFYGYTESYTFGDVRIMAAPADEQRGVLLELKGKGCRQFEHILLAQHRSWIDFFWDCLKAHGVFKRIDLAIDDKAGILSVPELTAKCENGECISVFRSYQGNRSGTLKSDDKNMGNTLYIGSMKSEVYFCIYEKDYEQYRKAGIPLEDAEVKNRFEIRLKNERAAHAVNDLLEYLDAEKTAFEIINRYVRFVDRDESRPPSKWKLNAQWEWFIGAGRGKLHLTTKPEPYTIAKSRAWMTRQVFPTLKALLVLDSLADTDFVNGGLKETRLTDKHRKILQQLMTPVADIILPPLEADPVDLERIKTEKSWDKASRKRNR